MSGNEHGDVATIQNLEQRLNRGWELIEQAEAEQDGRQIARYTEHWLALLAEYERVCADTSALESPTGETK